MEKMLKRQLGNVLQNTYNKVFLANARKQKSNRLMHLGADTPPPSTPHS